MTRTYSFILGKSKARIRVTPRADAGYFIIVEEQQVKKRKSVWKQLNVPQTEGVEILKTAFGDLLFSLKEKQSAV